MQRKIKELFHHKSDKHPHPNNHKAGFDESQGVRGSQIWGNGNKGNQDTRHSSAESIPERGRTRSVAVFPTGGDLRTESLPSGGPIPKRSTDPTVADPSNYGSQYRLPQSGALSIKSSGTNLGSDPRVVSIPSKKKYSEDIADRNIERSNTEHEAFQHRDSSPAQKHEFSPKNFDKRSSMASSNLSSGAMPLGGDSRSMQSPSTTEHGEDIADRTIKRSATEHDHSLQQRLSIPQPPRTGRQSAASVGSASDGRSPVPSVDSDDDLTPHKPHPQPQPQSQPHTISQKQLPHLPHPPHPPHLIARDESRMNKRTRRRDSHDEWIDDEGPQAGDYGPRLTKEELRHLNKTAKKGKMGKESRPKHIPLGGLHDGSPMDYHNSSSSGYSDEDASMTSSEMMDTEEKWAPVVTREHIHPHQHHIRQEQIYRDIHNHDVYHHIQPVVQTEILPAKHMVEDPSTGKLTEVPDDQVPARWKRRADELLSPIERKFSRKASSISSAEFPRPQARLSSPQVVDEWTQITHSGTVRKDSVVVHPSTLEPMGDYCGPVVPIEFCHHKQDGDGANEDVIQHQIRNESLDSVPDVLPFTLKELSDSLPKIDGSPESSSRSSAARSSTSFVTPPRRLSSQKATSGRPAAEIAKTTSV